jgi:hypothetical protein
VAGQGVVAYACRATASCVAWLVPASTPGISRRVARIAADLGESTVLLPLLTQFPARFRAGGDAGFLARLLSGNLGTQGLDRPVEYRCQALQDWPAVDHCEEREIPLSAGIRLTRGHRR